MDDKRRWNKSAIASFLIPLTILVLTYDLKDTDFIWRYSEAFESSFRAASLIGYALAIFSLISICRRPGQTGMAFAVCGLILNTLIPIPVLRPNTHWSQASCASNLKMVGNALYQYAQDHGGKLPPTDRWNEVVTKIVRYNGILYCPKVGIEKPAFAINHALTGIDFTRLQSPGEIVMAFECKPGADRVGGADIAEYRHQGGIYACFADGHVKWFSEKDFRVLMSLPIMLKKPTSSRVPSD